MSPTRSIWQIHNTPRQEADFVIVGAGITGASTAYWLRRLYPEARIAILDRDEVAAGASGRNAGFLLRGTAQNFADAVRTAGRDAAQWFHRFTGNSIRGLMTAVPADCCDLRRTGTLLVAGDAAEDEELRASAAMLEEDGERVAYWHPQEVASRTGACGFAGGLFDPEGATVDPVRLVRRLVALSHASQFPGHEVLAVEERSGRHRVETSHGTFVAPAVILALNAYLPLLLPELAPYVRPVRAQMVALRPEQGFRLTLPVYSHRGYFYARSTPDGSLLMGGARHLHVQEEAGYADATTKPLQDDLLAYLDRHFPKAGSLEPLVRWSGVMGFSPDGLPLVARSDPGLLWAAGFTGHGMAFGFGVGRLLARLALELDTGEEAVRFSPGRLD